jgi:hypothetical protein
MATAVAAGVTSVPVTAAGTYQFADRYGYVQIANGGTAVIFASADPSVETPTDATNNTVQIMPGDSAILANRNPLWYQSSRVIPQGANQFGGGNTASSPSSPGLVTPMESLAGQMANPGTTVSISAPTLGTGAVVTISGVG